MKPSGDAPLSIPQSSPLASYLSRKQEIEAAIDKVLRSGRYILGEEVAAFEHELARYLEVKHAIGVGSGTDALYLALRACGVGDGDLVVTVSHTAVATVAAIEMCGAHPVFVDIRGDDFTMDPAMAATAADRFQGRGLKAIVPVHLYGHPADMQSILSVAERYGLRVVEDCAQSAGATLMGKKAGSLGDISAFSFYPTKNLGAIGDAGAVAANDDELAERVMLLREYGWRDRISVMKGYNSRLDELQAAILRVKLRHLDSDNLSRRRIASIYDDSLKHTGIVLPRERQGADHVYHQYVVRTPRRDSLRAYLGDRGIGTLVHYPVPVHRQPAYSNTAPPVPSLPVTEQIVDEILSLPIFPELGDQEVGMVCSQILEWSGS